MKSAYQTVLVAASGLLMVLTTNLQAKETKIRLQDKTEIVGIVSGDIRSDSTALMLHQCNRDQSMWGPLVGNLIREGVSVLTVDMRGYGRSESKKYKISDQSWLEITEHFAKDLVDIDQHWRQLTPKANKRILVGASCGGGLSLSNAANHNDIDALVLLSPSIRERWTSSQDKELFKSKSETPVLGIASEEDKNALKSIEQVFEWSRSKDSQKIVYKGRMHGEPLFNYDSQLPETIVRWIKRVTADK